MSMARWWAAPASRPTSSWRSPAFTGRLRRSPNNRQSSGEHVMSTQAAIVAVTVVTLGAGSGNAAEVNFISSNAVKTVVQELAPQFEKATEHKLKITWGATAPLKTQIDKGEPFDVTALTNSAIEALIK